MSLPIADQTLQFSSSYHTPSTLYHSDSTENNGYLKPIVEYSYKSKFENEVCETKCEISSIRINSQENCEPPTIRHHNEHQNSKYTVQLNENFVYDTDKYDPYYSIDSSDVLPRPIDEVSFLL